MRTTEYMPEKTRPEETCKRCTTWKKKKKRKEKAPNMPKNLTNRPTYVNPMELPNQPCHVPSQMERVQPFPLRRRVQYADSPRPWSL